VTITDARVRAVLAAAMVASAGFALWVGRDTSFSRDELNWIIDTPGLDLRGALEPHGGHLILVPRLIYDAILHVSGVEYLPYRLLTVGAVLLTAGLFFAFATRRIGSLAALAPALVILVYGSDHNHVLQGSGFTVIFPLATGIGALLALERADRAGDVLACALLVLGLATYSTGIPFVAGAAALIMIGSDRWRRAWVFLVPSILYAAWLLWSQQATEGGAGSQATLSNILLFPSWAWDSLGTAGAAFVGLGYEFAGQQASPDRLVSGWGPVIAAIALAGLAWRLWRGPIGKWLWATMAILITLWLIGALGALDTALDVPDSTRYIFPATVAVLLVAVEAARGVRLGRGALLIIFAVAAVGIATNVRLLGDGAAGLRDGLALQRAGLTAVSIADGRLGGAFAGEQVGRMLRFTGEGGVATGYLRAVAEFGSPGFSVAELRTQPEGVRQEADRLLADNLPVELEPTRTRPTNCRRVEAAPGGGISVELPPGGAVLRSRNASEVRLRRFGAAFPADPIGSLDADVPTSLIVPPDLVPDPWYVGVPGAELEICDPVAPPS
jgi:hypothetical protein